MLVLANILQPLEDGAEAILTFFHDDVGFTWGTSIIFMTFVIRAILIPLTYRQIKGMREMQAYQPQIKEIQEKHKDDRQRMQREMASFFQEHKINPFASCLPLLLQLPVFIALFQLLRGESFERDVAASGDPGWFFIDSVTADPTGAELVILIVLFMASMALSSLVSLQMSPGGGSSQQYLFMGLFALLGVFFVPAFPAGLSLYWITTNFWTVGQQFVANKLIPPPSFPTPEETEAAKPPPPPPRKRKRRR